MSTDNVYSLSARSLEGEAVPLSLFSGNVTLIVNVASECGNTPQYAGLERVFCKYKERGFSVLGFPSNEFGKQEPGSPREIREFCSTRYDVTFPLFEKIATKSGPDQSPVYAALGAAAGELPTWNFGKYLVGRDGRVLAYFKPKTDPENPELIARIEQALEAV